MALIWEHNTCVTRTIWHIQSFSLPKFLLCFNNSIIVTLIPLHIHQEFGFLYRTLLSCDRCCNTSQAITHIFNSIKMAKLQKRIRPSNVVKQSAPELIVDSELPKVTAKDSKRAKLKHKLFKLLGRKVPTTYDTCKRCKLLNVCSSPPQKSLRKTQSRRSCQRHAQLLKILCFHHCPATTVR